MNKTKLAKLGEIKIKTGEYVDKEGKTKGRYQTVGVLFGTPHHSRLAIKFNATAFSNEKWANVYYDENAPHQIKDNLPTDAAVDAPIDLSEIPF